MRAGWVIAIGLLACDAGAPPPSTQLAAVRRFRDQMCACTETACATKVADDMAAWGAAEVQRYHGKVPEPSPEEQRALADLTTAMSDCMQRTMHGRVLNDRKECLDNPLAPGCN